MIAHVVRANISSDEFVYHAFIFGQTATLCGETHFFNREDKFVVVFTKEINCQKCEKACNELITTLQACLPSEPTVGELGLMSRSDDDYSFERLPPRLKSIYK